MALKINGVDGTFPIPRLVNKNYVYKNFNASMTATMVDGSEKTIDLRPTLNTIWAAVERKAAIGTCNEYFRKLNRRKTLAEILKEGDITIHLLEPKLGVKYKDVPYANTAGRDIAIDPNLLFAPQADLVCTLVHELAHVGGATTNASAPFVEAHAAEAALPMCGCAKQYQKDIVGSIQSFGGRRFGYA